MEIKVSRKNYFRKRSKRDFCPNFKFLYASQAQAFHKMSYHNSNVYLSKSIDTLYTLRQTPCITLQKNPDFSKLDFPIYSNIPDSYFPEYPFCHIRVSRIPLIIILRKHPVLSSYGWSIHNLHYFR